MWLDRGGLKLQQRVLGRGRVEVDAPDDKVVRRGLELAAVVTRNYGSDAHGGRVIGNGHLNGAVLVVRGVVEVVLSGQSRRRSGYSLARRGI